MHTRITSLADPALRAFFDRSQPIPRGMGELDGKLMPLTQARRSARNWAATVRPTGRAPREATNTVRHRRRTGASSATSSADPGDPDPPPAPARHTGGLEPIGPILDRYLTDLYERQGAGS